MTIARLLVTLAGGLGLLALAWYALGPRRSTRTALAPGVQTATVVVHGGYAPNLLRVRPGVPLRLVFDRREDGECSAEVVFPDFAVSRHLAPFASTRWSCARARCERVLSS